MREMAEIRFSNSREGDLCVGYSYCSRVQGAIRYHFTISFKERSIARLARKDDKETLLALTRIQRRFLAEQ